MSVRMMRIGDMRVDMSQGFVLMGMAVRSRCQRIVAMMVMAVVMSVGVLMIQGIMNVAVGMGFC